MAGLAREYYLQLRSILKSRPHLRPCLTRCGHCRIFFVTHPRNAGRKDLRCPFGCKQEHRRRESIRRSTAYYQGEQGRQYKRRQNQRQRGQVEVLNPTKTPVPPQAASPLCPAEVAAALPKAKDPELIGQVSVVVGLIEGRPVRLEEIWRMLLRVLRQHSMVRRRRIDQAVDWWNQKPP